MKTPVTVNPDAHLKQALLSLEHLETDIAVLRSWAQAGEMPADKVQTLREDLICNLAGIKARIVFALNDLEKIDAATSSLKK